MQRLNLHPYCHHRVTAINARNRITPDWMLQLCRETVPTMVKRYPISLAISLQHAPQIFSSRRTPRRDIHSSMRPNLHRRLRKGRLRPHTQTRNPKEYDSRCRHRPCSRRSSSVSSSPGSSLCPCPVACVAASGVPGPSRRHGNQPSVADGSPRCISHHDMRTGPRLQLSQQLAHHRRSALGRSC